MNWLTVAQSLPTGQKTRIDCDCGSGKTLIVNHFPRKYSAYCFRCDFDKYHIKGISTLAELAHLKQLNERTALLQLHKLELPDDFTTDIPFEGRRWLYAGGISPTTWQAHGIGYSPSLERVVLPVYDDRRNLLWYQMRAVHEGQEPKYIQPDRPRGNITYKVGVSRSNTQRAIVVEDILSAIRVGKYIPTYSLLGTKITTEQAAMLGHYDRVTTWMDDDTAGIQGALSVRKCVSLVTDCDNIRTTLDPKCLSNQQIEEALL
jgi:hypothetical protein